MVTTQQTHTSRNDQPFEKFDIRNFIDQLEPSKTKGKFICPVCGGNDLSIVPETGKYRCFNDCDCKDIREAIKPWAEVLAERHGNNYTPSPKRTVNKPKLIKPKPTLIPGDSSLVTLSEPATDIPQPQKLTSRPPKEVGGNATQIIYLYSEDQWVARYQWADASKEKGYSKTFRQWHRREDATIEMRKGEKPWTAYRLDEAIAAAKSEEKTPALLQVEGEKCVEILRLNQIAAITFQGSSWSKKSILPEYERIKQSGIGVILFLYDNDPTGLKKAEICSECANEVGIAFIAIDPVSICPDLPLKGDIEQILGQMETPEFIRKLEEQIHAAIEERSRQLVKEEEESFFDSDTTDSNDYKKRDFIDFSALSEDDQAWQQRKRWRSPQSYQGEIGWWKKREKDGEEFFDPACNFDFRVEREIQDADGGGLVLLVKRSFDDREVRVIINSTDYTKPDVFTDALKRAMGTGIVCNLSKIELNNLIHTRLHQYRTTRKGRLFKRIDRYGQQTDGTWVFEDRQYKKDGTPTNENESGWVFNASLGREDFIPCPELAPENPLALKRLVDASRAFLGTKNIYQMLLTIGWVTAGLNFREIFAQNKLFPILNCFGVPGSFKTVAAEVGASLIGKNWPELGILGRVSTSALYELGSRLGSIPFFLDDPERSAENEELTKNWYNCKPRRVRGNQQTPHCPMGITSNHIVGGEQPATFTRIVRVPYDVVTGGNKVAFQELKLAEAEASGAFPDLIALGYPKEAIDEIESELLEYLPHAHARIAQSLAIVTWYAQKVVDMTGGTENIKQWVIENCCGSENDSDASGDSLKDYLTKILTLESENLIGDWNFKRDVQRDGQLYHALYAHDAWKLLDHRFKPATYNERSLKALVIKAGGVTNVTSRFSCDRDQVLAYKRALLTPRTDVDGNAIRLNPPETLPRKAWLVPAALWDEDEKIDKPVTTVTACNQNPVTPSNPDDTRTFDHSNTNCNHVTKKNELEKEKEDEKKFNTIVNPTTPGIEPSNQDSGYGGYTPLESEKTKGNHAIEPVTEDQLQPVTRLQPAPDASLLATYHTPMLEDETVTGRDGGVTGKPEKSRHEEKNKSTKPSGHSLQEKIIDLWSDHPKLGELVVKASRKELDRALASWSDDQKAHVMSCLKTTQEADLMIMTIRNMPDQFDHDSVTKLIKCWKPGFREAVWYIMTPQEREVECFRQINPNGDLGNAQELGLFKLE